MTSVWVLESTIRSFDGNSSFVVGIYTSEENAELAKLELEEQAEEAQRELDELYKIRPCRKYLETSEEAEKAFLEKFREYYDEHGERERELCELKEYHPEKGEHELNVYPMELDKTNAL